MRRVLYVLTIMLSTTWTIWSQASFNHRMNLDYPAAIFSNVLVTDSAYYVVGLMADSIYPYRSGNMFLKFDLNGNLQWHKTIADTLQTFEVWTATLEPAISPQRGFVAIGYSFDEDHSGFLIHYDQFGDTLSLHKYKSYYYPENVLIIPEGFHQFENGNVILLNHVSNPIGSNHSAIYLNMMDTTGNILWQEIYDTDLSDRPTSLLVASNRDIIVGALQIGSNLSPNNYPAKSWVFRMDSLRKPIWQYHSPEGEYQAGATAMVFTPEEEIIVASGWGTPYVGASTTFIIWDGLFYKLNAQGELLWQTKFDVDAADSNVFNAMVAASDGSGYVAAGSVFRPNYAEEGYDISGWLAKVSPDGDSLWSRHIRVIESRADDHTLYDLKETADGGFIMVGEARDMGPIPSDSMVVRQQAWIVKVDQYGCIVPGCHTVATTDLEKPEIQLLLFPIPTSDRLNIFIRSENRPDGGLFRVVDSRGRELKRFAHHSREMTYILPLDQYPPGTYFLQYQEIGSLPYIQKFVVLR